MCVKLDIRISGVREEKKGKIKSIIPAKDALRMLELCIKVISYFVAVVELNVQFQKAIMLLTFCVKQIFDSKT